MGPYEAAFAGFYDRYFGDHAESSAPLLLRFLVAHGASGPLRLLDLGCGAGHLASWFLEAGHSVTGVDLSPAMVDLAKARCGHFLASGQAQFLTGDIVDLPLEGPFDVASSTYNSINHLDTPEKVQGCFRSVRWALKPGGWFLFDYHTPLGLSEWKRPESHRWEGGSLEVQGDFDGKGKAWMVLKGTLEGRSFEQRVENHFFPLENLSGWLQEAGFEKVRFARIDDLDRDLPDPLAQNRIIVIAS